MKVVRMMTYLALISTPLLMYFKERKQTNTEEVVLLSTLFKKFLKKFDS